MCGHQRAFQPKSHASNNKSRCSVQFYKAFRSHRSKAMLEPDAPFYLAINHQRKPNDKVLYLDRPLGKNEIGKFLKDAFAVAKLDDTNKKKISNHSVRKTSVGRLLEVDVHPNFVAQLSRHKKKIEKPRQLPFSISEARGTDGNVCYPESWEVHPLSPKKTKSVPPLQHSKMSSQSNKSTLRQFNFWWSAYWQVRRLHIQHQRFLWWSVEDRKAEWELSDRGTTRHYLDGSCTFGHFSWIVVSTTSFFIEPV